jgi:hypothetical protein
MVQQSRKTIVVTEETFEALRSLGNVTESFDRVIRRLIQQQKAVSGHDSFQGLEGQKTAAPLHRDPRGKTGK